MLFCFNALSKESSKQRIDRLSSAATAVFAKIISNFSPAFVAIGELDKCKAQDEIMVKLKTYISMDNAKYQNIVNSKIIEMSKHKSTSICLNKDSCTDDLYLVLNMVELMKNSYVASSSFTMRLVNTNAEYCKHVRKRAVHILNQ